ncbi:hypothetical protein F4859DRAFT_463764 [Xylaria cf. heliscus]|nr:hypothetical protein F4859DRAFT_463764 [Xylaria cf. heliscus]
MAISFHQDPRMDQFDVPGAAAFSDKTVQAGGLFTEDSQNEQDNWGCDIGYDGLHVNAELDAKRKRNRLAQRKHREQVRTQQRRQSNAIDSEQLHSPSPIADTPVDVSDYNTASPTNTRQSTDFFAPPKGSRSPRSSPVSDISMQMIGANPIHSAMCMELNPVIAPTAVVSKPSSLQPGSQATGDMLLQSGFPQHYMIGKTNQGHTLDLDPSGAFQLAHPGSSAAPDESIHATCSDALNFDSLESRMGHVLDAMTTVGFNSFDEAATAYYTATFSTGSLLNCAQSTSRVRRLRPFLATLRESAKTWMGREAQGYHDESSDAAQQPLVDELKRLGDFKRQGQEVDLKKRQFIADMINHLLRDETSDFLWRRDKRYLQELLPETWSLLSGIAQQLGMAELDASQAILPCNKLHHR